MSREQKTKITFQFNGDTIEYAVPEQEIAQELEKKVAAEKAAAQKVKAEQKKAAIEAKGIETARALVGKTLVTKIDIGFGIKGMRMLPKTFPAGTKLAVVEVDKEVGLSREKRSVSSDLVWFMIEGLKYPHDTGADKQWYASMPIIDEQTGELRGDLVDIAGEFMKSTAKNQFIKRQLKQKRVVTVAPISGQPLTDNEYRVLVAVLPVPEKHQSRDFYDKRVEIYSKKQRGNLGKALVGVEAVIGDRIILIDIGSPIINRIKNLKTGQTFQTKKQERMLINLRNGKTAKFIKYGW